MHWETPAFVEINMSAEIGGYQSDFEDGDPAGPPVAGAASVAPGEAAPPPDAA